MKLTKQTVLRIAITIGRETQDTSQHQSNPILSSFRIEDTGIFHRRKYAILLEDREIVSGLNQWTVRQMEQGA